MSSETQISEHTSNKQGYIYVIEGKGTFYLEREEIEMESGVIIHMNKNALHSLNAKENTSFILTLIN
jgi:quercetin dioxygenase-like cupin family protein